MKKLFDFIDSMKPLVDLLGYPTIRFYCDYAEVYFDFTNTIRDLSIFDLSLCDEFRLFASESILGSMTCVFTFYLLPFEEK